MIDINCKQCNKNFKIYPCFLKNKRGIFCSKACKHLWQKGVTINFKHGLSNTRFYKIWDSMNQRCKNIKDKSYKNYGARGIKVCNRWLNFKNFRDDMFKSYKDGLTIERINNNGNYEPSNCKWTTYREQANNTRRNKFLEYKGIKLTVSQWARKIGIAPDTLKRRLYYGWSIERALNTPVRGSF